MSWERTEKARSGWTLGIIASALLHLFVLLVNPDLFKVPVTESELERPIELTELPPSLQELEKKRSTPSPQSRSKSKQIEMAESEKADNNKEDPNAHILSDKTQTAEQQTKAKEVDDFRAKQGSGFKEGMQAHGGTPATGDPMAEKAKSELEVGDTEAADAAKAKGVKRDWKTLSLKDLGVLGDGGLAGASDDRLEGIAEGDRTILSTKEYRYFSYYHRIKELLRQHWKPSVERRLYKLWEKGKAMGEDEVTTKVLVLLTPDGKISKVSRVGSSGSSELDDAAIEAFYKASPFPNPPKGIVDADGFVRIRWDFILKTEAAPRIQFSNAGRPVP